MWRVLWARSALWSAPPQRRGDREGGFVLSRQDCSWFLSALTQLYPLPLGRLQAHPSGHAVPLQLELVSFTLPGLRFLRLHPRRALICSWASSPLSIWLLHIKVEVIVCQQRLWSEWSIKERLWRAWSVWIDSGILEPESPVNVIHSPPCQSIKYLHGP